MLFIDGTLKPGKKDDFLKAWSSQVLPLLKKQSGFIDEILLFENGTDHSSGLSFWKSQKDAERYHREVFHQAASHVEPFLEGFPTIRNFDIAASETFHITAHKAA
jgi:heme-degrading monooxygenase HmoA